MPKQIPKISDAEWEVMKVLWLKSPLTSSEIIEALKSTTKWNPKTIHTLINRLVNKGALGVTRDTHCYSYYPTVSENESKKEETKTFLKKVYDGSLQMLLASFIKEEKLSPKEIKDLKRILNDK